MAVSFLGSVFSAWRRQLPRRAPGKNMRTLLGGTVEAIGQNPSDPIGRFLVDRRALELLASAKTVSLHFPMG
jgi:hypothetical protein